MAMLLLLTIAAKTCAFAYAYCSGPAFKGKGIAAAMAQYVLAFAKTNNQPVTIYGLFVRQ